MKKLIYLFVMVVLVSGCATVSRITPNLRLEMTKEEVIDKCGNPTQSGAIKDKDGRTLESFMYNETVYETAIGSGRATPVTTYVYFADGKVIYYGNPNPTPEPIRTDYVPAVASSPQPSYQDNTQQVLMQQQQQVQQQLQQRQQQRIYLAPDGTYVGGKPRLAPDGTYVVGQPTLAPDGTFVGVNTGEN